MEIRLAIGSRTAPAETPIWDHRIKRLYWTDPFNCTDYRYDPATGADERAETRSMIGSALLCAAEGKLLVAVDEGMMLLDFATREMELIARPEPNAGDFSYDETRCNAAGRISTSTDSKRLTEPDFDPDRMSGKFNMIAPAGTVVTLADKIVQCNTPFLDDKNENLYEVDTGNKKLVRFDYSMKDGAGGAPETVIEFEDMPDGVLGCCIHCRQGASRDITTDVILERNSL